MPRHVPMRMCVHACTKRSEVNLRCCSLGNVLCFVWLFGVFLWQGLSPVWGLSSRLSGQWASGTSLTLSSQLGLLAVQIQEDPWSSLGFVADMVLRNVGPQACVAGIWLPGPSPTLLCVYIQMVTGINMILIPLTDLSWDSVVSWLRECLLYWNNAQRPWAFMGRDEVNHFPGFRRFQILLLIGSLTLD